MPAYNCAAWIDAFMGSLLAQNVEGWRLIVRDDKSQDNTGDELAKWQGELGKRMTVLPDSGKCNLGLIGNYTAVLTAATAPYVMSADPDDVWLPGKITRTMQAMRAAEATSGAGPPVAICTDAAVVDGNSRPIAPSLALVPHGSQADAGTGQGGDGECRPGIHHDDESRPSEMRTAH